MSKNIVGTPTVFKLSRLSSFITPTDQKIFNMLETPRNLDKTDTKHLLNIYHYNQTVGFMSFRNILAIRKIELKWNNHA